MEFKRNGRNGLHLPEGAEVHSADTQREVMTVREYLQKPMAPVTRGELAAFSEQLVKVQVRDLLAYVIDKRTEEIIRTVHAMMDEAAALERENRWYRRFSRWMSGIGRRAPGDPVSGSAARDARDTAPTAGPALVTENPETDYPAPLDHKSETGLTRDVADEARGPQG
jgi:hypothetical protein